MNNKKSPIEGISKTLYRFIIKADIYELIASKNFISTLIKEKKDERIKECEDMLKKLKEL